MLHVNQIWRLYQCGSTKMRKSVIRSVCAYLMSCKAHYQQCASFPIDRGPDLGKNWVGLGNMSNLVARRSMVISCGLLDDSITSLKEYTIGLWWIILTLDRWSMTSTNTILHTVPVSWIGHTRWIIHVSVKLKLIQQVPELEFCDYCKTQDLC